MNRFIDNFGCIKIRRSANISRLCLFAVFVVNCEAETGKFGDIGIVDEYIAGLNVSMDNIVVVHVLQCQRDLTNDLRRLILR